MYDKIIIKLLLNKYIYNKYRKYINIKNKEYDNIYLILDNIHNNINRDILYSEFKLYVLQKQDNKLTEFVESLEKEEINNDVAEHAVQEYIKQQWAHDVALKAISVYEGKGTLEALQQEYDRVNTLFSTDETSLLDDNFQQMMVDISREGGLKWRLPFLNDSLGGLHKGDFGFIFARTNAGKSTLIASEVSFMLSQLDTPCCFFFNEEAGKRMKFRIFQAYFGATIERITENIAKCEERFLEETKGNLKFFDMPIIKKTEVESICKEFNPSLIIIDNIDKVHGFKGDREDLRLGSIYTWSRELAKQYSPLIAVCQAGASAENKKWLTHNDINSAHTAKSSEADFILGVGHVYDVGYEDVRYLRLVKNKFKPGEFKGEVYINANKARFEEMK